MSAWRHAPATLVHLSLAVLLVLTLAAANLRFFISINYIDWQYGQLQAAQLIDRNWPTAAAATPIIEYLHHLHQGLPGLTGREALHMAEVRALLDTIFISAFISALILTGLLATLRLSVSPPRFWRHLFITTLMAAGLLVPLSAGLHLNFNFIFSQFHALFFTGGSWQFGSDSTLIRLFPLPFWAMTARDWGLLTLIEVATIATVCAGKYYLISSKPPKQPAKFVRKAKITVPD